MHGVTVLICVVQTVSNTTTSLLLHTIAERVPNSKSHWKHHPTLKRKYYRYLEDPGAADKMYMDVVNLNTQVQWSACMIEDPDNVGHFFYCKVLLG